MLLRDGRSSAIGLKGDCISDGTQGIKANVQVFLYASTTRLRIRSASQITGRGIWMSGMTGAGGVDGWIKE